MHIIEVSCHLSKFSCHWVRSVAGDCKEHYTLDVSYMSSVAVMCWDVVRYDVYFSML